MKLRTWLVVLAASLTLVACSPGADEPPAGATASPSGDGSGTLHVWLMRDSQPQSLIDAVNRTFHADHPDVDVEVELKDWNGIQDQLATSLTSDASPDVVEIGNNLTVRYADAGLLADLTGQADALGVDRMLPGLRPSGEWLDARYGVPYYGGPRVVVYDKKQFEQAGITKPPTSLDALAEDAAKLQDANAGNPDYSAFWFPGKYWYAAVPFVWAEGGGIATLDGDRWTATLDSAQSRAGLARLKGLVEKYSKAPEDVDETGNVDAFVTGDVGMMIDSWWVPGALEKGDLKDRVGAFALPGVEAGTTAPALLAGSDLAVSAKSRSQGLAVDWLKIITGVDVQKQLAGEGGVVPNQEDAFAGHDGNPFLQVADQAALNARFTPVSPYWANVVSSGVLPDMLVSIFTDSASIDDATTTASERITATLNGE